MIVNDNEIENNNDDDNDENIFNSSYGFALVSEAELRRNENSLKGLLDDAQNRHSASTEQLKQVLKLVVPFLTDLSAEPTREYIRWKNRSTVVNELLKRINNIVE